MNTEKMVFANNEPVMIYCNITGYLKNSFLST